jgi:leader peptidase (prepilin peptidase)/N-methyltransferase
MIVALPAVAGLVVGSFLNVVAHRLPRAQSIVRPGSACPGCGAPVRPYDNVPVVSWLLLRGHCRSCGTAISPRYPAVEALTAALWVAVVVRYGFDADALLGLAFVTLLVPVALIDLDHRIIPNQLMALGAVAGLALVALTKTDDLAEHLIAAAAAGGFLLAAVLAYPRGMGMGDVKLAAVMGLFLGRSVAPAMLIAMVAGTVVGAMVIARKGAREGRKTAVPFGPFLALGGIVALFAGPAIVDWYLATFTG